MQQLICPIVAESDGLRIPHCDLHYDLRAAFEILSAYKKWLVSTCTTTSSVQSEERVVCDDKLCDELCDEFQKDALETNHYLDLIRQSPESLLSNGGRCVSLDDRIARLLYTAYGRGCADIRFDDESRHARFAVIVGRRLGISDVDVIGQATDTRFPLYEYTHNDLDDDV